MSPNFSGIKHNFPAHKRDWSSPFMESHVPGAAISVGARDIAKMHTVGVNANHKGNRCRVGTDTVFEAGSLSKPVVSYLVYALEQAGLIQPETPLLAQLHPKEQQAVLLQDLHDTLSHDRARQITYELILKHNSGFTGWRADRALAIPHAPAEAFIYSGEGYLFLQRFLELRFKSNIEALFQEHVFEKVGFCLSSFFCPKPSATNLAIGHNEHGQTLPKFTDAKPVIAGSLHTSLADYTSFILHLLENPVNCSHYVDWVKKFSIPTPVAGITWGKGWGILERSDQAPLLWHWGDTGGYKCFVIVNTRTTQFLNYFTNSYKGLSILDEVITINDYDLSREEILAITALISTVTNQEKEKLRYWFDYDQAKSFFTQTY